MPNARRYGTLLLTAGLLIGLATVPAGADRLPDLPNVPDPAKLAAPTVTARSAAVYNRTTHLWVYKKAAATRRPIASITKVMTAYVVLKNARWKTKVTIGKAAVAHARKGGATTAGMRAGEKITLGQALYGMLLPSGADIAYQLAHNYGPGNSAFVAKMNKAARALHMTHTRYANADGMPSAKSQYSTAADQLKLLNAVLNSKSFRTVVRTWRYRLNAGGGHRAHTWTNTNRLLGAYQGAHGVKTGTTNAAGYCLAFSAYRTKLNVIGVVLHSSSTDKRFSDATKLLNYAYGKPTLRVPLRNLPLGQNPD